jgi:hypothetical protein
MIETEAREHEGRLAESWERAVDAVEEATWNLVALAYARAGCQGTRGAELLVDEDEGVVVLVAAKDGRVPRAWWTERLAELHAALEAVGIKTLGLGTHAARDRSACALVLDVAGPAAEMRLSWVLEQLPGLSEGM